MSYNEADVFDNIGRASYSIGFMTGRAFEIDITTPNCGLETFEPIMRKYDIEHILNAFEARVLGISYAHPFEEIGTDLHPEMILSKIDQFEFRATVALSCLLEKGNGKDLKKTLKSFTTTAKQKAKLLTSILDAKVSDIGKSINNHDCLAQIKKY